MGIVSKSTGGFDETTWGLVGLSEEAKLWENERRKYEMSSKRYQPAH